MSSDQWQQVENLFAKALEVSPDEWTAFLEQYCDDPAVRTEVASLLAARDEAPRFFEDMAEGVVAPMVSDFEHADEEADSLLDPPDLTDRRVGAYRLEEEIGVGGMGVVYRAVRTGEDFEQTVAVKLLQRRLHAEGAERRFRAERQVLASLNHPNIADLISGGVTDGGRPYLVMEYVEGQPITAYAEEKGLDLEARLALLDQVFEAVRAAHRQLVVHRDLKPSNVMVTETDGAARVKLLDFGIAKLLDDSLPVTQPETRTGQHLMTPAYAAPEQIRGAEVTTATDVYQLGVLAYELLVGTRPFDLAGKSLTEIERILLEESPRPPSESARTNEREAADRLRGDLDQILLQALRKEPERRYPSVEALATDLERYRAGEPVDARPATLAYRARKFLARNRGAVATGAVIVVLVVAYAVTVTVQADRLAEQRDRVQTEAETTEQVRAYLVDLFQAGNPMQTAGETPTAKTLVERGIERADQLKGQPLVQAEMLYSLGQAAAGLGQWNRADRLLERSLSLRKSHLEAPHPDLVASLRRVASVRRRQDKPGRAAPVYRQALTMSRQLNETTHRPALLDGLAESLADTGAPDSAAALMRQAIALRRQKEGDYSEQPLDQMELAGFLQKAGRAEEAKALYREGLDRLRRDTSAVSLSKRAQAYSDFAYFLNQNGDHAEAERQARTAVSLNVRAHGRTHYTARRARTHLFAALVQQGKYEAALPVRRTQLSVAQQRYDAPHYRIALQHTLLGRDLDNLGAAEEALPHLRRGLDMMRTVTGPNHLWTHFTRIPYALCLAGKGRLDEAERLLDRLEPVVERTNPDSTSLSVNRMKSEIAVARGEIHLQREQWKQAEDRLQEGYRSQRQQTSRSAPLTQRALESLITVYERSGRSQQAENYSDSLTAMGRSANGS
jgi:serine/threonine-protein kinase